MISKERELLYTMARYLVHEGSDTTREALRRLEDGDDIDEAHKLINDRIDAVVKAVRAGWDDDRARELRRVDEPKGKFLGWTVRCPNLDCGHTWKWHAEGSDRIKPTKTRCPQCGSVITEFEEIREEKVWENVKIKCRCGEHYEVRSGTSLTDIQNLCPRCDRGLLTTGYSVEERVNTAERFHRPDVLVSMEEVRLLMLFDGEDSIEEEDVNRLLELERIINKIDWSLLSDQKKRLVELAASHTLGVGFEGAIEGVIHLLDDLGDWADDLRDCDDE